MSTKDFLDSLHHKRRSIDDLMRFIGSRTEETPNYNLLIGAGCSVTSGIRTGNTLIEGWREAIYNELKGDEAPPYSEQDAIEYLTQHHGAWYNSANEYSSLFEKHYDLPRQRRMFIEQEVAGKFPSIGYLYLIRMVEVGLFRTLFTTNFDDLLNETFYQFSNHRPVVCAHDSTAQSILVTSQRAKIIKLHGDYLFDDIKSTVRETESLEGNIKNKLMDFSKDFGLVVVGYGGADRSIMDVLNQMLRSDELVNSGIYWCLRETDDLHDEVRKLLWKDRVYYVPIKGFDELMAEFYANEFGNRLPIEPTIEMGTSQPKLSNMISSLESCSTNHPILAKHLTELKRERHQNSMYSLLNEISSPGQFRFRDDESESEDIQDDQLQAEMRLISLTKKDKLTEAEKMAKQLIDTAQPVNRRRLIGRLLNIYEIQEKYEDGIKWSKILQGEEPQNPTHLLTQARLERCSKNKFPLINEALELNPMYVNAINLKARVEMRQLFNDPIRTSSSAQEVIETARQSIQIDPDPRNPAWDISLDAAKFLTKISKDSINTIEDLFRDLSKYDRWSPTFFNYRIELASIQGIKESDIELILEDLAIAYQRTQIGEEHTYEIAALTCFSLLKDRSRISAKFVDCDAKFKHRTTYVIEKARIQLETLGDIKSATKTLIAAHELNNSSRITEDLARFYIYAELYDEAEHLVESTSSSKLNGISRLRFKRDIAVGREDFKQALDMQGRMEVLGDEDNNYVTENAFILLSAGRHDDAASILNEYLHSVNFNTDCATEVINYELARHCQGKKVSKTRLNEIVSAVDDGLSKLAAYILLEKYDAAYDLLKKEIELDYSAKYIVRRWPLMRLVSDKVKFKRLLSVDVMTNDPP